MIELPNGVIWDETLAYDNQSEEALAWVDEIIKSNTPIIDNESVRNGTSVRPKCQVYVIGNIEVKECFFYKMNSENSRSFLALKDYKIEISHV